jgi:hypothetical protein
MQDNDKIRHLAHWYIGALFKPRQGQMFGPNHDRHVVNDINGIIIFSQRATY